jgi:Fur family zinc uptake transcriptional regulator
MADCGHEHHHAHLSEDALAGELANAASRTETAGQKLTPPRRRVLELLLRAGQPVKAYDLIAAFGEDGAPAKPPTVYRALEFLEREGFAHRIESLNAFVACGQPAGGEAPVHAAAFLICDCCGATREIASHGASPMAALGEAAGYAVSSVTIEAHGLCADCRS